LHPGNPRVFKRFPNFPCYLRPNFRLYISNSNHTKHANKQPASTKKGSIVSCESEQGAVEDAEAAVGAAEVKCIEADPQSPGYSSCQAELMAARARLDTARQQLTECRTAMRVLEAEGLITFLRVHETGSGYGGGQSNFLDVEAVFKLDCAPEKAFGFQMRNDSFLPATHGMLDLLRDAIVNGLRVIVDFFEPLNPPNQNCRAVRIAVLKPAPSRLWPGQPTPM
jgi:hypothetical protein